MTAATLALATGDKRASRQATPTLPPPPKHGSDRDYSERFVFGRSPVSPFEITELPKRANTRFTDAIGMFFAPSRQACLAAATSPPGPAVDVAGAEVDEDEEDEQPRRALSAVAPTTRRRRAKRGITPVYGPPAEIDCLAGQQRRARSADWPGLARRAGCSSVNSVWLTSPAPQGGHPDRVRQGVAAPGDK